MYENIITYSIQNISEVTKASRSSIVKVLNNYMGISEEYVAVFSASLILITFFLIISLLIYVVIGSRKNNSHKTKPVEKNISEKAVLPQKLEEEYMHEELKTDRELKDCLGLIIELFGRGMSEYKIFQIIYAITNEQTSEEDVIQLVLSIKKFIKLCRKDEFLYLKQYYNLPSKEQALLSLANGRISDVVAMLRALIEDTITSIIKNYDDNREKKIKKTIDLLNMLGNILMLKDQQAALFNFNLALRLDTNNILTISRIADIYSQLEDQEKAEDLYLKIIETVKLEDNLQFIANADSKLSNKFVQEKDNETAKMLIDFSDECYNEMGMYREIGQEETIALEIINSNLPNTVKNSIELLLTL